MGRLRGGEPADDLEVLEYGAADLFDEGFCGVGEWCEFSDDHLDRGVVGCDAGGRCHGEEGEDHRQRGEEARSFPGLVIPAETLACHMDRPPFRYPSLDVVM